MHKLTQKNPISKLQVFKLVPWLYFLKFQPKIFIPITIEKIYLNNFLNNKNKLKFGLITLINIFIYLFILILNYCALFYSTIIKL